MANLIRGEVVLDVAGDKYPLCLDVDTICEAERILDMGFGAIVDHALYRKNASYRISRGLMQAASGGKIDAVRSAEIVQEHIIQIWPQIQQLVIAALPPSKEDGDADPPKAPAAAPAVAPDGTGPSS